MFIIILGGPGTGKGTQAGLLSGTLGIPAVSTGELLRQEVSNHSEEGKIASKYMIAGKWVPSNITIEVLAKRLNKLDLEKGVIIDAFPRLIGEKDLLKDYLKSKSIEIDFVFNLNVDDKVALERIQSRRKHPNSKRTVRHDESDEITLKRISLHKSTSNEILKAFKAEGKLIHIDGNRSVEAIQKEILSHIKQS